MANVLKIIFVLPILLVGCNGLDRLTTGQHSRNEVYDVSPTHQDERLEPYAMFAGYHLDGDAFEKLYIVHWDGNALGNVSLTESEIDQLNIPKFSL